MANISRADFNDNVDEELAVGQIVKIRKTTLNSIRSYLRRKFGEDERFSLESWAESVKVLMLQKDNKKLSGLAAHDNKTGGTC